MKGKLEILKQNLEINTKFSLGSHNDASMKTLSKPMAQQTLNFFRNLKVNRFVVPLQTSTEESLRIYYKEYKLLYQENKRLNLQFIDIITEKNELTQTLISKKVKFQINVQKLNQSRGGKIKRRRRYAFQIKKQFICEMKQCRKCYGSEGSLTQHVKIKHDKYFKSGNYDIYLAQILRDKQTLETASM